MSASASAAAPSSASSGSGAVAAPTGRRIVLFDVDGTLTASRGRATPALLGFLKRLRGVTATGMVGGSDLAKQREQLGEDVLDIFDYVFPENGLVAYKAGSPLASTSIREHLGEASLKALINFCLIYIGNLDIPIKRGTFVEFRTGMLNVCPIGRNCSQAERDEFERYDAAHGVRKVRADGGRTAGKLAG